MIKMLMTAPIDAPATILNTGPVLPLFLSSEISLLHHTFRTPAWYMLQAHLLPEEPRPDETFHF